MARPRRRFPVAIRFRQREVNGALDHSACRCLKTSCVVVVKLDAKSHIRIQTDATRVLRSQVSENSFPATSRMTTSGLLLKTDCRIAVASPVSPTLRRLQHADEEVLTTRSLVCSTWLTPKPMTISMP